MTVQQALQWGRQVLAQAGLPEAPREAQILLGACLGWDRARLLAYPEAPLSARQQHRFECWVRRRARREPLAYITRRAWFYGLELTVGRGVLVPRPETELLVELFLSRAQEGALSTPPVLVDAGTGSGAVAIACLRHAPGWYAIGVDRSRRALALARMNRRRYGLQSRLLLIQADWLTALRARSVSAVLSNPPYVLPDEWDALQPEITRYEPREALLVPAEDPLQPYRRIALDARRVLLSPGLLAFETSPRLAPMLVDALAAWGFEEPQVMPDYSGMARVVWAWRR